MPSTVDVNPNRTRSHAATVRHDWTTAEIRALHDLPLLELVFRAASVHREFQDAREVQVCKLISIKTGACPEDCSYCSQSSRYETEVEAQPLMEKERVLTLARDAKAAGVSRVCMGAAWRGVKDGAQFERVLEMVKDVTAMGVEVCCTLGLVNETQAKRLEDAGLYAYNHNLDTSEGHYKSVITTRTYQDRLDTLANVRKTNVTVCSGGILGLGEKISDRIELLHTLATLDTHPESVQVNILSKVEGTPLQNQEEVPFDETLRMIATARLVMPASMVRLSAGRVTLSTWQQGLCFLAGANSIFSSETGTMLTSAVPSPDYDADKAMLATLGLTMRPPFKGKEMAVCPDEGAACARMVEE
ncbi:MAG: biotin synthase BioB [Verrucomicrobia bacterium]|nr:biotin synthase BioB [Verrucomicrobiota bacterium]